MSGAAYPDIERAAEIAWQAQQPVYTSGRQAPLTAQEVARLPLDLMIAATCERHHSDGFDNHAARQDAIAEARAWLADHPEMDELEILAIAEERNVL